MYRNENNIDIGYKMNEMGQVNAARIAKLKRLMREEYDGKQVRLAEQLDVQPDYLSRMFRGVKGLSSDMARKYEKRLNKPKYWLDEEDVNVYAVARTGSKVPLISWVRAGAFIESPNNFSPGSAEEWLDCPVPHSDRSYCLQVVGDSMDAEGGYRDGEIIFIDPDIEAMPGKDVVVRTPDGKMTFKRLKEDEAGLYLLGLNGKRIIRIPDGIVFCGVVIFSGFKR